MRWFLFCLLFLASAACTNDGALYEHKDERAVMRLLAAPCVNKASRAVIESMGEDPSKYSSASFVIDGQKYEGCYVVVQEMNGVCMVSEKGGHIDVPLSYFTKLTGS